jgi:uncharacterized membrane protein YfcA
LLTGVFSGLFGIGGGLILVPALVYLAKFTQHQAQGTTLAILVLPVGILAAMRYYQSGQVNLSVVALICLGFVVGGYFGADLALRISDPMLKRAFGIFMLLAAVRMIFSK